MPRTTGTQAINTFVAGLITESTELTQPRNSSTDEDNCLLFNEGNRTRRRGVDFEAGFQLSTTSYTDTELETFALNSFTWSAVAGNGSRNFAVIQAGNDLKFYDLGGPGALSDNEKPFSIDLSTTTAPSFATAEDIQVQFDTGNGVLFVSGQKIDPFIVEYDSNTDNITLTPINIQIRDFAGADDGLDIDEEPVALSDEHNYNLQNQGWFETKQGNDPVARYFSQASVYPPNSLQWFAAVTGSGLVDTPALRRLAIGNTLAPKGHFIVDAFNIDRSAVSGVPNIAVESVNNRPTAIAFFAGRVWYAGTEGPKVNTNIYYSQVLEDLDQAGRCYQVGDPTDETDPLLVDTDGGVVVIPEMGTVKRLLPVGASMIIFSDNGVWQITGPDGIFRATDFSVTKITTQGAVSGETVVNIAGTPVWWGEDGILSLVADKVSGIFSATSISENTIQRFYNDIPAESKQNAKGVFDQVAKKVVWLFKSTAANGVDRYRYDRLLWLDSNVRSFYPWTVSDLASDSPYLVSVFVSPEISTSSVDETVTDSGGTVVTDSGAVIVTAGTGTNLQVSSTLQFVSMVPDGGGSNNFTFANFDNNNLLDWEQADGTGVEYLSFAETWWELNDDILRQVQAPYLYIYLKRTEDTFVPIGGGSYELDNPSSLLVTAKWDWSNSAVSNRWSRQFEAYRFKRPPIADPSLVFDTGYPIVITRNKIRGKGRALQFRFESNGTNDFNLLGWATVFEGNAAV